MSKVKNEKQKTCQATNKRKKKERDKKALENGLHIMKKEYRKRVVRTRNLQIKISRNKRK